MATTTRYKQGEPSLQVLNNLAKEITGCWYVLGVELGVDGANLDNIRHDITHLSPREKAFAMLQKWYDQGTSSDYAKLAQALVSEDKRYLAEKYCHGN